MPQLPLAKANRMIREALSKAGELGLKPLAVSVLDAGGHPVAYQRQDGSSMLRFEIGETVHASDGAEFEATFLAERDLVEDCLEERFPGLWTPNDDD